MNCNSSLSCVDSHVHELRSNETLGTSVLDLIACQFQKSTDQEDGCPFTQSWGMTALPQAHREGELSSGGAGRMR